DPWMPTLTVSPDLEAEEFLRHAEKPVERVIVKVYMPWVTAYNAEFDPLRDLVYAPPLDGPPLVVGDKVLCPPSPKHSAPFEGIVIGLDGSKLPYRGPVKRLMRRVE